MFKKILCLTVMGCFFLTNLGSVPLAHADSILGLPVPGSMVSLSPSFKPALIRGLRIHQDNPFLFDFIVDPGQDMSLQGASSETKQSLKYQSDRMVKYFFAALTIPDKDIWVNLSPYEKDRMVPKALGVTAMGRDLLAQDYMLKQLTASLIYPQKALGKTFWNKVYTKAKEVYGTTQIPVNTFNKVWIVPQRVGIYEHGQTAFIVDGHLKVMLEEDYLSLSKHNAISSPLFKEEILSTSPALTKERNLSFPPLCEANKEGVRGSSHNIHTLSSNIIRAIILPEIEKEVNAGKNFSTLRQIFYAQSLAVWFKRNLKQALLNHVYANKSTVKGIDQNKSATNEAIYHQYLQAYKKGVFNFIKEDIDPMTQEALPRKYFSGGYGDLEREAITPAQLAPNAVNGMVLATVALVRTSAQASVLVQDIAKASAAMSPAPIRTVERGSGKSLTSSAMISSGLLYFLASSISGLLAITISDKLYFKKSIALETVDANRTRITVNLPALLTSNKRYRQKVIDELKALSGKFDGTFELKKGQWISISLETPQSITETQDKIDELIIETQNKKTPRPLNMLFGIPFDRAKAEGKTNFYDRYRYVLNKLLKRDHQKFLEI
ncbi:MAG: hypothetical protein HQL13_05855, partial [Candidatus Omnitrophica bacterium]|nr:hypothetical protein [Candidatus Omnitrophota bacterium]